MTGGPPSGPRSVTFTPRNAAPGLTGRAIAGSNPPPFGRPYRPLRPADLAIGPAARAARGVTNANPRRVRSTRPGCVQWSAPRRSSDAHEERATHGAAGCRPREIGSTEPPTVPGNRAGWPASYVNPLSILRNSAAPVAASSPLPSSRRCGGTRRTAHQRDAPGRPHATDPRRGRLPSRPTGKRRQGAHRAQPVPPARRVSRARRAPRA
jgi:hypothetical protein